MPRITFRDDDRTVDAAKDDWLYDVCVDARASIPFSCKAGACGTCATEVLAGEASYTTPPLETPGPDELLICSARPTTDLVIDL